MKEEEEEEEREEKKNVEDKGTRTRVDFKRVCNGEKKGHHKNRTGALYSSSTSMI